jgi:uncharacterized protein YbjT (DUF2867 family)
MIVVAGGTGTLGSLLVRALTDRGLEVRVMSRDPARAAHLVGGRVSVVQADVRDPAATDEAVAGATTVVSAVHGLAGPGRVTPATVDRDGNAHLVESAARAGAAVVLMSVVGAAPDSPMELFRMKAAAEQHLRSTAPRWTVVRSSAFLETWVALLRQTAARSGRPVVLGRGENPINFVSAADVAAVLVEIVTGAGASGRTVEVGGPQALTMNELAALVQQADHRDRAPRHVPRPALRALGAVPGLQPARLARSALAMDTIDLTFAGAGPGCEPPIVPSTTAGSLLAPGGMLAR